MQYLVWQELAFIQAMLACKRGASQAVVSSLLKEAAELHFSAIQGLPLGVEYFEKLNPSFLFDVVKTNLAVCQVNIATLTWAMIDVQHSQWNNQKWKNSISWYLRLSSGDYTVFY